MPIELAKELKQVPAASPESLSYDEKSSFDLLAKADGADDASSIEVPDHPWRIKGPAIFLALFLTLGSNYATSIIPPLKSTLKEELDINNAQYAVVSACSWAPN